MKNVYEIFEFPLIKEKLLHYANTELSQQYISSLEMFEEEEALSLSLKELNEAMSYSQKYGRINVFFHPNLIPELTTIKKGGIGNKEFFYHISFLLENIKSIKEEFKEKENYPLINEMISSLINLEQVKSRIDRVIGPTLEILDTASSNLMRIRSKILHLENSISSLANNLVDKYRNYLSDNNKSMKNGVFTLCVKSTYKNRVQGIVLDVSDTGLTVFIEPQELIEVYNNIASLKEEEIREIQLILKDLSNFISNYSNDLMENTFVISKLDFIFAKANFSLSYQGEICKISQEKKIYLISAAHPLIDKNKIVRNDFVLDKQKMMIITGPNAGGKTVALKVVGLLVIMHQCGLALPVYSGELSFFKNIYADIGDNQSILDNLSTFSSHIVKIRDILNVVDKDSLVIIDELGSGTSPLDGEALGLGVIDYLLKINCFSLISSHYEAIKNYSLENDDILCASMVFDEKRLSPTYRLRFHVASSSYGIEVSERLGLNQDVIKRAKEYITNRKLTDKEVKIEILNKRLEETEKLKTELLEKEHSLDLLKKELNEQAEKNKELRNKIILSAEEEKEEIVNKAKEEIDNIFAEFKNLENIKMHQVIEAKRKIDNKLEIKEEEYEDADVNVNDEVEIIASKTRGKVIRIDKDRVTILTLEGLSIQTKKNAIRKCEIIKKKFKKVYTPDLISNMKNVPTECNVIGMTVNDALPIVQKYLDDAVTVHYSQVRIIHGSGTGRLRTGVQNYLKTSPYVASFRLGGAGEGGVGATVVYLK